MTPPRAKVTLAFLAERLIELSAALEQMKEACARCPHRDGTAIGFRAPDVPSDCKGGSLLSENTHQLDRDLDEFDEPTERVGRSAQVPTKRNRGA